MKQALALSALAVLGAASVAPAMAGPYLTTKVGAKGEGSDFDKSYIETRVGYETKVGRFTPYVEGGFGVAYPEGGDSETFKALEVGSKVKITKQFSAYGKYENIFQDSDDTRDWKVEFGTKYKF